MQQMMEIRRLIPLESGTYDPNYEPALKEIPQMRQDPGGFMKHH